MFTKKNFGTSPAGYVAGVGRGAIGFTTRSDIGPARNDYGPTAETPIMAPGQTSELSSYDESQFDKFSGYHEALFSGVACDRDDITAERIYEAIDSRMDSRRRSRREKLEKEMKNITLDVYELFQNDKKELSKLSIEDWENIPEAGQQTKRPKLKSRAEKYTPVPDLLIHSAHEQALQNIDQSGTITPLAPSPIAPSPISGAATPVNLTQLGHAREKVLDMTLGKLSDSVDGQTVVDPKGYLTDLKSKMFSGDSDVSDIEKARLLFKSITTTNPTSAPGWIGAARLEEYAGKQSLARKIVLAGCDQCPDSEDLWVEAARLHDPKRARAIVARAVSYLPQSVNLWLRAVRLEAKREPKRVVARKALELVPNSIDLWKTAIELEEEDDARIMLSKAVKCVPKSVDLWLALARLEDYVNAKRVLNEARHALPSEARIWIAAAKLEEAHGTADVVSKILAKGIRSLRLHGVIIDRDFWLKEAYECEKTDSPLTCQAIVREVIGVDIDEADRKLTWTADAETALRLGKVETARAIYGHMLSIFKSKSSIWWEAVMLEKENGTYETLCSLLAEGVKHCPRSEPLWLLYAKEKWLHGETEAARGILAEAFDKNKESEAICLAAVKLEFESQDNEKARQILTRAREFIKKPRIFMKSAIFERELGNSQNELDLLKEATKNFSSNPKLWMMLGQFYERSDNIKEARSVYQTALKHCQKSTALWICFAKFELKNDKNSTKARSILETAKLKIPHSAKLWLASIKLEAQVDKPTADRLLAKALQECPKSGEIWAYAIESEIKPKRKGKCHDALKTLPDDPFIFLVAAKIFWAERKLEKARNWFERSLSSLPDLGDTWIFYYAFLLNHGTEEEQSKLIQRCVEAEPRHGEKWIEISKRIGSLRMKTEEILKTAAENIKNLS